MTDISLVRPVMVKAVTFTAVYGTRFDIKRVASSHVGRYTLDRV